MSRKESIYEKERRAIKKKAKRRVRLMSTALAFVIVFSLIACYALVLKPAKNYEIAEDAMNRGDWAAARDGFKALGSFRDSRRLASYTDCMALFDAGELSKAADAYLALRKEDQLNVQLSLGSFGEMAENAVDEGKYREAYVYYSLDADNPERDDAMYAISVYLDSEQLIAEKRYDEARSEITAYLSQSHALSAPLQNLMDGSYETEFNYYDSFTWTDLAFAVNGMEAIRDEYEPAHVYLRDLRSAYYGGVLSMNEGKYQDAIAQFEDIQAYADSAVKMDECRVLLANQQAEAGQDQAALETVKLVANWQDYLELLPEDNSLSSLLLAGKASPEDDNEPNA